MVVAVMIAAVVGIVGAWGASVLESGGRLGRWASRCFLAAMVLTLAIPMILACRRLGGNRGQVWLDHHDANGLLAAMRHRLMDSSAVWWHAAGFMGSLGAPSSPWLAGTGRGEWRQR